MKTSSVAVPGRHGHPRPCGHPVTAGQESPDLSELFDAHVAAEFVAKDAGATIATMTDAPTVIHVPVLTGGRGRDELHAFYRDHFIPSWPDNVEPIPLSRTVNDERVVDEFIVRFTHSREMPYRLLFIPALGTRLHPLPLSPLVPPVC